MPLPYMRPEGAALPPLPRRRAKALDAAFAVFAEDDRREATRLAGAAYKRSVASDALATAGASSGGGLLAAPGYEAARERDDAVTRAIDALPGPAPALFRGDLQNALDNSWRGGAAEDGRVTSSNLWAIIREERSTCLRVVNYGCIAITGVVCVYRVVSTL